MDLRPFGAIFAAQVHTNFIVRMPLKLTVISKVARALYAEKTRMAVKMPSEA
jgi:hypothetical protein